MAPDRTSGPFPPIQDLLVVKAGNLFVCSSRSGDIDGEARPGEGLYHSDTRFLSALEVAVGERTPVLSSSTAELGYRAEIAAAGAGFSVRRSRVVHDRMYERIELTNGPDTAVRTTLAVVMEVDFADMFEVRGIYERDRGDAPAPIVDKDSASFSCLGADAVLRRSLIRLSPPPDTVVPRGARLEARWELRLPPGKSSAVEFSVDPSVGDARGRGESFATAARRAGESHRRQQRRFTKPRTKNVAWDGILSAAMRDIRILETPFGGRTVVTAGIPWYVALFGRDSLLAALMLLSLDPNYARDTLVVLAAHQSESHDSFRDAEPGKILHEFRLGELAGAGFIPQSPYFGTADATPLFVMVAAAYYEWTGDRDTLTRLLPHLDAALRWIDEYGDQDGDGFVEYLRQSPAGLVNHGWKDSDDAVVHEDGSRATSPIAPVEVQGYVYAAKHGIAAVYDDLGFIERARRLRREAERLRLCFDDAYWMRADGFYALALDGAKRQVRSVTSNPGHCLFAGIVEPARAGRVIDRLMVADMFTGWGIRTLSSDSPAYDPLSYHNGSVWPHDTALIAAGAARYGRGEIAMKITTALTDLAAAAAGQRLPELVSGFARVPGRPFVPYPTACSPQAWAAAVPFLLLQTVLGTTPANHSSSR